MHNVARCNDHQDTFVFTGSVRDNIEFGAHDIDELSEVRTNTLPRSGLVLPSSMSRACLGKVPLIHVLYVHNKPLNQLQQNNGGVVVCRRSASPGSRYAIGIGWRIA
jgi:hypothetical protein